MTNEERNHPRQPAIWAHRGGLPENTLAAFRAAVDLGVEGVELDVALTSDGVPVALHDATIDRTTNGTGAVTELTIDELQAFDAGNGERIPRVADVLPVIAGKTQITFDIKDAQAIPAILELVAQHPELAWVATSSSQEALQELRRVAPDARIQTGSLGSAGQDDLREFARAAGYPEEKIDAVLEALSKRQRGLDAAIEFAKGIGAAGISVWDRGLTAEGVERLHAAGLSAGAWTVNDPERAAELFGFGVDSIATDVPEALLAVRARVLGA